MTNSPLAYAAPALAGLAVLCWIVGFYSMIRFSMGIFQFKRSTGAKWPSPFSSPMAQLKFQFHLLQTLPPNCRSHIRRCFVCVLLFVGLLAAAAIIANIAGPLRLHR